MPAQPTTFRDDNRSVELTKFLSHQNTGCLATTDGTDAFTAIIFFVYDDGRLFFKSHTTSNHSTHLCSNTKASFGVYLETSTYEAKYGAQLLGKATRVRDAKTMQLVVQLYSDRFSGSAAKLPSIQELCSENIASTFYQFTIEKFKIIDEDKVHAHKHTMLDYKKFQNSHS